MSHIAEVFKEKARYENSDVNHPMPHHTAPSALKRLTLILSFTLLLASAAQAVTKSVKDPPFNAVGDGVTNDRPAFAAALASLAPGDVLTVPAGTYRIVTTGGPLYLRPGTTLRGAGPQSSIIKLHTDGGTAYREFLRPGGSNVVLENLKIERAANFPAVLLPLHDGSNPSNITVRNCVIVGNRNLYSEYCHAIRLGYNTVSNILLDNITVTTCSFGLYGDSASTGTVNGVTVRNSTFTNNYMSDLEFNAPNGVLNNVLVTNCTFRDNHSTGPGAGWAVGLANVQTAQILDCNITNYLTSGIHVEDRSSDVLISGNRLVNTSSYPLSDSPIAVINNSNGVLIDDNFIDLRGNPRNIALVDVGIGGNSSFTVPLNVDVDNNTFILGSASRAWALHSGCGATPNGNSIRWEAETTPISASSVSVGAFNDPNATGGVAHYLNANAPEDYVAYTLPWVHSGTYQVVARVKKSSNRGRFQLSIGGVAQGLVEDLYSSGEQYAELNLGTRRFSVGAACEFRFTVTGKSPASSGYALVIDHIRLDPVPSGNVPENLAATGVISSYSNQESANPAANAIDGFADTNENRWSAGVPGYPQSIVVDLGADKAIAGTELVGYQDRAYKFRVEARSQNGAYQTVLNRTANTQGGVISDGFASFTARYVRLTVTGAHNYTGGFVALREFKVFAAGTVLSDADIGAPSIAGSSTESGGVHTLTASGADIYGTSDQFRYVYRSMTGDGEIVARVHSLTRPDDWTKAGVMMRESLAANSRNVAALVSAHGQRRMQHRSSTGGSTITEGGTASAPLWLRLVRSGSIFTSYYSTNGSQWTQMGSPRTVSMGATIYVGLALTSHTNSALATAVIDSVTWPTKAEPISGSLFSQDVGSPSLSGSATAVGGTYTLQAGGTDIYGTADQFHYLYKEMTGDGTVTARVQSLTYSDLWAKAGVMMRESLVSNSKNAMTLVSAGDQSRFQTRINTGGSTAGSGGAVSKPYWVRLVRSGDTFTGYGSTNGTSWTQIGSPQTIYMSQTIYVGIATTSHNTGQLTTAVFDNLTLPQN